MSNSQSPIYLPFDHSGKSGSGKTVFVEGEDHPHYDSVREQLNVIAGIASNFKGRTAYISGRRTDLTDLELTKLQAIEVEYSMAFVFDE